MEKLKKILFKKHYIREMFILFFIVLSLLFLSIYTSFAMFEKTIEKVGVASIQASTLDVKMSTNEDPTETTTKNITVLAGATQFVDVTLTNNSSTAVKYKLYYQNTNTDDNVTIGISSNSENEESGILNSYETEGYQKEVRVGIENISENDITITLGVESGYAHNELALSIGSELVETINELVVPEYIEPQIFVDSSGANEPELAEGMIPVVYDETYDIWVVANEEAGYYAYQDQIWANAVTTSDESYRTASAGTPIPMEDINSMWVWIPRYKYNIPSNIGSAEEVLEPPQINVVFEDGINATGVTESVYRAGISDDGTNTNYYTHPAFRNGSSVYNNEPYDIGGWDEELTGFWTGKFRTQKKDECSEIVDSSCIDVSDPVIKPDYASWSYFNVANSFKLSLAFAGGTIDENGDVSFVGNDTYGLTASTDTHMMKSTEWGAITFLSQSQYGKMGNNNYSSSNKEIYYNYWDEFYISGRSSGTSAENTDYETLYSYNDKKCSVNTIACSTIEVPFSGTGASTTGTIYGIYDMSSSGEIVMGYLDFPEFYPDDVYVRSYSGFNNKYYTDGLSLPGRKYYDLYKNNDNEDYFSPEYLILGDPLWETSGWYSDNFNTTENFGNWIFSTQYGIWDFGNHPGFGMEPASHTILIP